MALLLQSKESGFAIVIAVSLGLIMLLVGTTMVLRSQGDQVLSSKQKQTNESLAAAEKGIAFYKELFNSSSTRGLVYYSSCEDRGDDKPYQAGQDCKDTAGSRTWATVESDINDMKRLGTGCGDSDLDTIADTYASTEWKDANEPLNANAQSSQQFRLVEYTSQRVESAKIPVKNIGRLVVEGQITGGDPDSPNSVTRLAISFPVLDGDINTIPIPGVWIGGDSDTTGTGKNNIEGDILLNCGTTLAKDAMSNMKENIQGTHSVRLSSLKQPEMPSIGSQRSIDTDAVSSTTTSSTSKKNKNNSDDWGFDDSGFGDSGSGDSGSVDNNHIPGYIPLNSISGNTTVKLPYDGGTTHPSYADITNPSGIADENFAKDSFAGIDDDVYVYKIPSIGGNGSNVDIKIRPKTKIAIYVDGNISGKVSITCDETYTPRTGTDDPPAGCSDHNPMNLMIFGTSTQDDAEICIQGNDVIQAFVLAPNYDVGIAGSGSQPGNYQGAVWSKSWGCNNENATGEATLAVKQVGSWDEIPGRIRGSMIEQYPPEIDATGTWERRESNKDKI